jgi:hypothetical protein
LPIEETTEPENETELENDLPAESAGRGKKGTPSVMAGGAQSGKGVAGALRNAMAILEGVLREPPPKELKALLERLSSGRGLYLYVH